MKTETFLGSWMLRACYRLEDGKMAEPAALGEGANGCIHYLADGRMAVLIQFGNAPGLARPPEQASDAEIAAVARRFFAYAGTWSVTEDRVIHHLDTCSNPRDVGTDYVRTVEFRDDHLILGTEPETVDGKRVELKLDWQAVSPRPA